MNSDYAHTHGHAMYSVCAAHARVCEERVRRVRVHNSAVAKQRINVHTQN